MKTAKYYPLLTIILASQALAQVIPPPPAKPPLVSSCPEGVVCADERLVQGSYPLVFPLRNTELAKSFYGNNLQFLQNVFLSGTLDRGSAYTELVSGHAGFARLALGTVVSAAVDSSGDDPTELDAQQKANLQNLVAGGGTIAANLLIPLAFVQSKSSPENMAIVSFAPRASINIPILGNTSTTTNLNTDIGLEAYGALAFGENLTAFVDARIGGLFGDKTYYNSIGFNGPFWIGQASLGVRMFDFVQLSAIWLYAGPSALRDAFPLSVGLSMLPGKTPAQNK